MSRDRFPATRHSVVAAIGSDDGEEREQAWNMLVAAYWKPVYTYLRFRWRVLHEDAEDLTQGFFTRAFDLGFLAGFDPAKARFRTFLRVCLDRHVLKEREAAGRQKRGGGAMHLSLDFAAAAADYAERLPDPAADPEQLFRQEWVRALFEDAVAALEARADAEGKQVSFSVFRAYDLDGPDRPERPTYEELARRHGVPPTQVTNYLSAMRRAFRRQVLERLRALAGSEAEFREEAKELLGVDPP